MGDTENGGGVNWDAAPHRQLWEWFSEPRLTELEGWLDSFTDKVAAHFQAAADKVDQALRAAGVRWEGAAADAMRTASTPLGEHALRAKEAATASGIATLSQVMHARNTAMAMPEPRPVPDQTIPLTASAGELFLVLKDVREQEAAAREAEQRARDLARSYDAAADDAVAALPRFEPAPSATVSRAVPADVTVVDGPREPGAGPDQGPSPRQGEGPDGPGSAPAGPGQATPERPGTPGAGAPVPGDGTSGQGWTPSPPGGAPPASTLPGPGDGAQAQRPTTAVPVTGLGGPGPGGGASGPRPTTGPHAPRPGGFPPVGGPRPGAGVRGGPAGDGLAAARANAAPAHGRGAAGVAPIGGGRSRGDEDRERTSPEYLRDYNDDFWDGTPPVAPAVIGEDEDEG